MARSLQGVKHLILTQQKNKSEIELFFDNFKDKSYKIESDPFAHQSFGPILPEWGYFSFHKYLLDQHYYHHFCRIQF